MEREEQRETTLTRCQRDFRLRFLDLICEPSGEGPGVFVQAARGLLWGLSWGYWAATGVRSALYRRGVLRTSRLPVPVISVGNLTCGGTGKTPLVQWIARYLVGCKRRVAILSRGYRGSGQTSDESQAIQDGLAGVPHLLGADRVKTGERAARELGAECLILDDGFQHLRLHRDLDIVTVDALNPFGYGYLLPRGLLREPVGALRRADVVVLTRTDQCVREAVEALKEQALKIAPSLLVAEGVHRPTGIVRWADGERLEADSLAGKKVLAFCGIGNPRSFTLTLQSVGANVAGQVDFADHHCYDAADLEALRSEARRVGAEAVVATRKDAVKIGRDADLGAPLFVMDVALEITRGLEAFEQRIRSACAV